jgi:hypothetical protein
MDVHIVRAQMFVGNLNPSVVKVLERMSRDEVLSLTSCVPACDPPCKREDCLLNWDIEVDEHSVQFESDAFVREDFVMLLQDYVRGMQ